MKTKNFVIKTKKISGFKAINLQKDCDQFNELRKI